MPRRLAVRFILCLLLCAFAPALSHGQSATAAALHITLTDPAGAALPAASIILTSAETGLVQSLHTGASGELLLPELAPGSYSLAIAAQGFRRESLPQVYLHAGIVSDLALALTLASVDTSVLVPDAPAIDATPSALATTLTADNLLQLPVDGLHWQSLALLAPGTIPADPDDTDDTLISFHGLSPLQTATQVDGLSDDQTFASAPRGQAGNIDTTPDTAEADEPGHSPGVSPGQGRRAGTPYTFSQSAIREFRVHAQNYSALYGSSAGGLITAVSNSGTTALHGSALYLIRSSIFAATEPFSVASSYRDGAITTSYVKPHDLRQQAAVSLGGPILLPKSLPFKPPGKLFFFAAFDLLARGYPAISSPGYPGFYSLTPGQTALLLNRGVPTPAINTALNYLSSLTGTVPRSTVQDVAFARADWQLNPASSLGLQYNRARWNSPAGARSAAVVSRGAASLGNAAGAVDALIARWHLQATPAFTNLLSVELSRDLESQSAQTALSQEPAIGPAGQPPEINIGPAGETFSFGTPANVGGPSDPDERRIEAADLATFEHRHHLVQLGFDISFTSDFTDTLANSAGTFRYDSSFLNGHAGGLVDWITDFTFNVNAYPNGACPSITVANHLFCFKSFTQGFGGTQAAFTTSDYGLFLQDQWRPTRRLQLHAGIRYDYSLLPLPQTPNAALDGAVGTLPGHHGATNTFPEDRNNIAPRIGAEWQPFGPRGGVLRLGYGIYFGRLPGATIRAALIATALPTSTTYIRITPATITPCPQSSSQAGQGFGYVCSYLVPPPAAIAATSSAIVFDSRFRLPLVQQGSLAYTQPLPHGLSISATYLLNLDRQLTNSTDLNIAPALATRTFQVAGGAGMHGLAPGQIFSVPVYTQRLSPAFGPVTDIVSDSNATYHALVLELDSREAVRTPDRLTLRLNWTWSKALDYGQNGGGQSSSATPRQNAQFDPYTLGYDKGLSTLNIPQRLVAVAACTTRLSAGHPMLHATLNGLQTSAIFTEHSGLPYSYEIYGGTFLSGGRESINGSGGATYLPTIGRNTLRLPLAYTLDLRLSRAFRPLPQRAERLQLRAQAEAFNLTNHVSYTGLQQRAFLVGTAVAGITPLIFQDAATVASEGLNTRPFGSFNATASGSARQLQLSLRLTF